MSGKTIYCHPDDGMEISVSKFDQETYFLVVTGMPDHADAIQEPAYIPIGPAGLVELGKLLIEIGQCGAAA